MERCQKRAQALLGVEGYDSEAVKAYFQSKSEPLSETAIEADEQRLYLELSEALEQDRRRQKQRILTLEIVWAILGLTVLFLGFNMFTSFEAAAISSQETPLPETPGPTASPGAFLPTATPFPFESTQANGRSLAPAISQDGRYIVFVSEATNLAAGDTNAAADIFLYDRVGESISLVSQGLEGQPADGASGGASISADGRFIAFTSWATNLVMEPKRACAATADFERPCADVYLYDREEE